MLPSIGDSIIKMPCEITVSTEAILSPCHKYSIPSFGKGVNLKCNSAHRLAYALNVFVSVFLT